MAVVPFRSGAELIMFLTSIVVGLTMVMGVNAVNSAPSFMLDYFKYIDKSPDAVPRYPKFWTNVLTFYTVVTLVAQAIHEPTNLTTFMCRFTLLFRLLASIALMLVELLVIVIMPHTAVSELGAMIGIIFVAYIGGLARGYFENTGYALFAPCPSHMLSGMLVGSALSGALVSVIQIIIKASMPDTYDSVLTQSIIYFSFAIGVISLAAVLLLSLLLNPFARQYIAELRNHPRGWRAVYFNASASAAAVASSAEDLSVADRQSLSPTKPHTTAAIAHHAGQVLEDDSDAAATAASRHVTAVADSDNLLFNYSLVAAPREPLAAVEGEGSPLDGALKRQPSPYGDGAADESCAGATAADADADAAALVDAATGVTAAPSELLQHVRLWPILKVIWPMMLTNFLTFGITYLLYPGIMLAVDTEDAWYGTIVMAVYNFGDLFGRVASMWTRLWPPRRALVAAAVARLVFLPLLLLCAFGKIPTHAAAYVLTAAVAVSNGFVGTLSMVYAPATPGLRTDGERALAGQAVGVCLLLGCAVGSLIQLAEVLPFN